MSTVYTLNGKVLKNSANDKWLAKKEAPAGFIMNASNATISAPWVSWEGPAYPDAYIGDGKQYILVNNNAEAITDGNFKLMYANANNNGGPDAISHTDMMNLGTNSGTLANNTYTAGGFGKYFTLNFGSMTLEQIQEYMANVSITIVDP